MAIHDGSRLISSGSQSISHEARALLSAANALLRAIVAFWIGRLERARGIHELSRFTDRELWDIGLSRSDIDAIQKGHYRRE
jgi:uncharacterized protein YjiS (DUF1127 family)